MQIDHLADCILARAEEMTGSKFTVEEGPLGTLEYDIPKDSAFAMRILADLQVQLANKFYLATGSLALGKIDNTFKVIEAAVENYNGLMIDSLRVAEWWEPIRDDPRFDDMLDLLDSKVTHTETYLKSLDPSGK